MFWARQIQVEQVRDARYLPSAYAFTTFASWKTDLRHKHMNVSLHYGMSEK